ncbi:MAG: hypothetical protein AB7N80_05920 [Bdellovibrionales bacterium]
MRFFSAATRILLATTGALVLVACDNLASVEDEKNRNRAKLTDSDLVITQNLNNPQFNIFNYFQSENPHTEIEKNFRFTGLNPQNYQIDQDSFTTASCTGAHGNFALYLVNSNQTVEITSSTQFRAVANNLLKVVFSNPGSCRSLNYRFSILPIGN